MLTQRKCRTLSHSAHDGWILGHLELVKLSLELLCALFMLNLPLVIYEPSVLRGPFLARTQRPDVTEGLVIELIRLVRREVELLERFVDEGLIYLARRQRAAPRAEVSRRRVLSTRLLHVP